MAGHNCKLYSLLKQKIPQEVAAGVAVAVGCSNHIQFQEWFAEWEDSMADPSQKRIHQMQVEGSSCKEVETCYIEGAAQDMHQVACSHNQVAALWVVQVDPNS